MNLKTSLLAAAYSAGVPDKYYGLCTKFPFVDGVPYRKVAAKDVLAAATGHIEISKLSGPGTVFQLNGLPAGVSLKFIVQSGGTVETHFCITVDDQEAFDTFAGFCKECLEHQGLPPLQPPYPRPECNSAEDLIATFKELRELVLLLSRAIPGPGK
jgi:hypothetical protein